MNATADHETCQGGTEGKAILEIAPGRSWWRLPWGEIWSHRYLFRLLLQKELLATHKQSILGPLWFIVQPVVSAMLFALIFGRFAGLAPRTVPRFLFYLSATVPWTYFQSAALGAAGSLAANASIMGKVYFPRLLAPLVAAGVSSVHAFIHYGVFLMALTPHVIRSETDHRALLAIIPAGLLLLGLTAALGLGVGLWGAAAGVKYRDFRFALPVVLQTWMFATPIIYPSRLVPAAWRPILFLNPMAGIVETHRHLCFNTPAPHPGMLLAGIFMTLLILLSGILLFQRTQRTFVDVI